jgi:hypothetical protein
VSPPAGFSNEYRREVFNKTGAYLRFLFAPRRGSGHWIRELNGKVIWMSRARAVLLITLLFVVLSIVIVLCTDELSKEMKGTVVVSVMTMLMGAYMGVLLNRMKFFGDIGSEVVREINEFEVLHKAVTREMRRIADSELKRRVNMNILSFTPAFGNISTPSLYDGLNEDGKEDAAAKKSGFVYKDLLENIARNKWYIVDVKIICYNERKRRKYHENWADAKAERGEIAEEKKSEFVEKWERQAKDIIGIVRDKWGTSSVVEVEEMQPLLFFSTDNVLIQYTIRNYSRIEGKSRVKGFKITGDDNGKFLDFFSQSFEEYYYTPGKVVELYERYFGAKREYISAAKDVKGRLDDCARARKRRINEMSILLAYGGGKDSTMILVFLKYVQDMFLKESRIPFKLHILVHIHPGMRKNVLRNIHNVFKCLGLDMDSNVEIAFRSKGVVISAKDFITEEFDTGNVLIPDKSKKEFIREILLAGHLSRGLGRHTFCYACNIDMIMTIIDYTLEKGGKIDYIVTGDSKEEQEKYADWLNPVFNFINGKKDADIRKDGYGAEFFFRDFIKLQNAFKSYLETGNKNFSNNYLKAGNQKTDKNKKKFEYPELFVIQDYVQFSELSDYEELLKDGLGFAFHEDSFNFSETDCFYPAVMAHMAGLRGGEENYAEYLRCHVDHAVGVMEDKRFTQDLMTQARTHYATEISEEKRKDIEKFLEEKLCIDEKKLDTMICSPFLDDGRKLQSFLEERNIGLNGGSVINYIKKGSISIFGHVKEKMTGGKGKEKKIETFLDEWTGLSREDIKRIMKYSENPRKDELLEMIADADPYVREVDVGDGTTITVSGR